MKLEASLRNVDADDANVVHGRLSPERTPRAILPWRIVTPWEGGRPLHRLLRRSKNMTTELDNALMDALTAAASKEQRIDARTGRAVVVVLSAAISAALSSEDRIAIGDTLDDESPAIVANALSRAFAHNDGNAIRVAIDEALDDTERTDLIHAIASTKASITSDAPQLMVHPGLIFVGGVLTGVAIRALGDILAPTMNRLGEKLADWLMSE